MIIFHEPLLRFPDQSFEFGKLQVTAVLPENQVIVVGWSICQYKEKKEKKKISDYP